MSREQQRPSPPKIARRMVLASVLGAAGFWLAACAGGHLTLPGGGSRPEAQPQPQAPAQPAAIGQGQVRVALILPLSAQGNVGLTAQSMKNAAELALSEFKNPEHSDSAQGRWWNLGRRAVRSPTGAQRGRRIDPGTAICAVCCRSRTGRPPARHSGHRLLQRRQRRGARCLSAQFPARVRCRSNRRLCRRARKAFLRGADSGQCLWQRCRRRIAAGGRAAAGRARRRAGALSGERRRSATAGAADRHRRPPGRRAVHSRQRHQRGAGWSRH